MQRTANRLTARKVQTVKAPGLHADGAGLYLRVGKGSARAWVFIYRRRNKRTELGLGSARDVSLSEARDRAAACRKHLVVGDDPRQVRKGHAVPTFGELADQYIETHSRNWSNPRHIAQWKMTLGEYAAPIRRMPVDQICVDDVLGVLRPIWDRAPETASRLRGRLEAVLNAAKAQGLRAGENPAAWKGNLQHLLPARKRLTRGHHAAIPYKDLPSFMTALRAQTGVAARALEFTILTAARSNEVRGAEWPEIDLAACVWTVPAGRMKARREHRVPIASGALCILQDLKAAGQSGLIFPGQRGHRPLSDSSLGAVLKRMQIEATVHGFRSSFKDWAREQTSFSRELSEAALAHVIGDKTEAAYARGDLLERRRELMEAWGAFCLDGLEAQA